MAMLIQEVICGEYAFVIHTNNPVSGDSSEIYTEVRELSSISAALENNSNNGIIKKLSISQIVKGLGETLVGAYPGRAMSFITKKTNLKSPTVRNKRIV